jgi:hypothetical protein
VEIISQEKRKKVFMVGSQEEVGEDRKVGFLVNLVKMIKKEQNLAEEKMLLKELSKDVGQLVPLVKPIKEGRVLLEVERNPKERYVLLRL